MSNRYQVELTRFGVPIEGVVMTDDYAVFSITHRLLAGVRRIPCPNHAREYQMIFFQVVLIATANQP